MDGVSIVVPIYNEEGSVKELHLRLTAILAPIGRDYEIVFVNDGSRDKTLDLLKEIQSFDRTVTVIELSRNFGQTAALAAGIDHATKEIIVTMDGDLQHQPEEIPVFLTKLDQGFDIVSGWRQVRTDSAVMRKLPSFCANWLARRLSGVEIGGFGSTFKAYRSDLVKRLELFGELHRFIPLLAHRIGARTVEIPIAVAPRKSGESNYGLWRTFGVFQDLVFLSFYLKYLTKPIRAFGTLFFLFFGAGFLISLALMVLWSFGLISAVLEHEALLLLSVLLMIIGIQFLATGVLAELLTRIYLHTSQTRIYSVRKVHKTEINSSS